MKQYSFIYKTTCLINNKIYIGQHTTNKLDDEYLGSGTLLKHDIDKFGKEHFQREILFYCENQEELNHKEAQIVDEEFIARDDTYNIQVGGNYDSENFNYSKGRIAANKKFQIKLKEDKEFYDAWYRKSFAKNVVEQRRLSRKKTCEQIGYPFLNKRHNDESKKKIGKANSKHQSGKGNSNYGNCWIHNLELKQSKSIPKSDLKQWLNQGWIKGRKINF